MEQLNNEELANIAHDYYLARLTIGEIVEKYDLSRYLVTKSLEKAQKEGIVKITIKHQTRRNTNLESELQKQFGLKDAIVLKDLATTNQDNEAIVSNAAEQIQSYLKKAKFVGLTWGTLLHDIIDNFQEEKRNDLTFVQLTGVPINSLTRKNPLADQAAEKYNGKFLMFPAPLYVLNSSFLSTLKTEPFYKTLTDTYNKLDLIFFSLGTLSSFSDSSYTRVHYKNALFKDIPENKIAGMIFGRPYDINGHFFGDFNNHVCSISFEQLKKVSVRFLIVKNRFKAQALLGALRTGMITHLITNEGIAQRVLQNNKE